MVVYKVHVFVFSCSPQRWSTDLVSLVGPWELPVMGLLAQEVEVAVGELRSLGGNLHGEPGGDAVGALLVHQSESLEVPWRKHRGDLGGGHV